MKEFKKMKKFGAAVTVAAMLGSFSVGVFADEVDPETVEVPEVPAVEESVLPEVPVVEEEPAAAPEEEVSEEAPVVEEEPEADSEEEAPAEEEPAEEDEVVTLAGGEDLISGADEAHAIQITGATATLDTEKNLYTVTLNYEFNSSVTVGENSQITMLGYIFSSEQVDSEDPTNPSKVAVVEGKIRAIDQQTTKATGSIKFGLAKKTEASAESDLVVEGTEKMVVKLGTDVEGVTKAQAFFINLANASEGGSGPEPEGLIGDADGSGEVDGLDAIAIQEFVLYEIPVAKPDLSDADGSGEIDGLDAIAVQEYVLYEIPLAGAEK